MAERRGLLAWALYDWANSPFTTLIITFVFPAYFGRAVVGDEVQGQVLWGYAVGLSGLAIAIAGPIVGAIADAGGRRKPWLFVFTLLCASLSALLWFVQPEAAWTAMALLCVGIANACFEFGIIFNNAMLPDLVPQDRIGRWSGWAWGLGYAGGLAALGLALAAFLYAETPLLGLDPERAEQVRIVGPLVAAWFAAFAWPLFVFTPDRAYRGLPPGRAIRLGLATLRGTLTQLPAHANLARFLVAHLLYADALVAVFAFGGIYAAGTFGMTIAEVILLGILLNVAAGLGAFAFAWIDDWIGSRRTILIALAGLISGSAAAVLAGTKSAFWIAALMIGMFVGPAQAASRSLMARIAPAGQKTEYFGLFALSGKATAFVGPMLVGTVTAVTQSQRLGLASLLVLFVSGFVLLLGVRETGRTPGA